MFFNLHVTCMMNDVIDAFIILLIAVKSRVLLFMMTGSIKLYLDSEWTGLRVMKQIAKCTIDEDHQNT